MLYQRNDGFKNSIMIVDNNEKYIESINLRVLLVLDRLNIGGTETHVLSLATELVNQGIHVVILSDSGPLSIEFENLNCKIYNTDFPFSIVSNLNEKIRYENTIKEIIKKEDINLVHAHQSPSGALCIDVCSEINIGCVFTVHGLYYEDIVSDRLKLVDKVISVSQPVYDWLLEFDIPSVLIPNAVNFDKLMCTQCNKNIRDELNISEDALIILYCSRLAWKKATVAENLIRTCRDLKKMEDLDINLLILGDGPDFNKILASSQRANQILKNEFIHVLGPKTDLSDYYLTCDCVVGTGRVAIEAMAFERPVIASGNYAYFGILNESNLYNSWNVYFGDHKSSQISKSSYLYNDLKYIYSHKEELSATASACNNWAKKNFDIKIVIKNIITIYKNSIHESNI